MNDDSEKYEELFKRSQSEPESRRLLPPEPSRKAMVRDFWAEYNQW